MALRGLVGPERGLGSAGIRTRTINISSKTKNPVAAQRRVLCAKAAPSGSAFSGAANRALLHAVVREGDTFIDDEDLRSLPQLDRKLRFHRTPARSSRYNAMNNLRRLLFLTDRLLMHLDHEMPAEKEVIEELREVADKVRLEHALDELFEPKR
jgi:hypothetical protein